MCLGDAVGKQDQYISAFGGLTCFDFQKDGSVQVSPLRLSNETIHDLEAHLLMFFHRGFPQCRGRAGRPEGPLGVRRCRLFENLHVVKRLGIESRHALERGNTALFGELMLEHWQYKKNRFGGMSNGDIDHWFQAAMDAGAIGGKLVGAGGGGFLLFYTRNPSELRKAMFVEGLEELRFAFDHDGSIVLART